MEPFNQGYRSPDAEENPGSWYHQRLGCQARPRAPTTYIHVKQGHEHRPLDPPTFEPRLPSPHIYTVYIYIYKKGKIRKSNVVKVKSFMKGNKFERESYCRLLRIYKRESVWKEGTLRGKGRGRWEVGSWMPHSSREIATPL